MLGIRSRIGHDVELDGVLVMGNDVYETEAERAEARGSGVPPLGIGEGTVIRRAIVDKGARIGRGVRILNEDGHVDHDGDGYYVRDGIVIVPRLATVADGTRI